MDNYVLAYSPHITGKTTVSNIMGIVLIALLPACVAAVYYFGLSALITIVVCTAAAVGTEALIQFLSHKPITVGDLSAAVTGVLLALNLPSNVPLYVPIVGAVFAIAICKQCFGGLGNNFINPALAGRAFLMVAWPVAMTTYVTPLAVDTIASATPLAQMHDGLATSSIMDMFLGNTPGALGETCALALLVGGLILICTRVISYRIPVIYIATVALGALLINGPDMVLPQILSGGLFLGAFFMATDYVSSPATPLAQVIYAFGCGFLTVVIRNYSGYREGVCFSIMLMNLTVPLLERAFRPKKYGEVCGK